MVKITSNMIIMLLTLIWGISALLTFISVFYIPFLISSVLLSIAFIVSDFRNYRRKKKNE